MILGIIIGVAAGIILGATVGLVLLSAISSFPEE